MSKPTRVLVLEHDPYDIELLHREIRKHDPAAAIETVATKKEFTDCLLHFKPDIIFSDYSLPGFTGNIAFSVVQKTAPEIPFIFVSGTIGEETAVELIKKGATDFILKERLFQVGPKMDRALKEARDKKEKALMAEELSQREEHLQKIMDQSPDMIFTLDRNDCFLNVGAASRKVFGQAPEGLLGKSLLELVNAPSRESVADNLCRAREGMEVTNLESSFSRQDGSCITLMLSARWGVAEGVMYCVAKDVTEINAAREMLAKSEFGLKQAQALSHMGNWEVDFITGEESWSDEIYRIYGFEPGEVEPSLEMFYSVIHPDDLKMVQDIIKQSQQDGQARPFIHRIIRKGGEERVCYSESRFWYDRQGKPIGIHGISHDITEKTRKEEAILAKSQLLAALAEASKLLLKNEDWREALQESFGIIGETVSVDRVFYFENWRDPVSGEKFTSQKIEWVSKGTTPKQGNLAFQNMPVESLGEVGSRLGNEGILAANTKDLPEVPFRKMLEAYHVKAFLVIPIFIQGKFHGLIGFDDCKNERQWSEDELAFLRTLASSIADCIHRAAVNQQLKQSEEEYRKLFNLSPLPMWIFDVETLRFLAVNEAAIKHYGYSREEFLEMTLKDIRDFEDQGELQQVASTVKNSNPYSRGVYSHCKKNGEKIKVDVQTNFLEFDGRNARLVLAVDVSERLHYVKAIEDQNQQLKDIAWTQSHTVRAPLARIMGVANLLTSFNREQMDEETIELLGSIVDSSNELDEVIKGIVRKTEQVQEYSPNS